MMMAAGLPLVAASGLSRALCVLNRQHSQHSMCVLEQGALQPPLASCVDRASVKSLGKRKKEKRDKPLKLCCSKQITAAP